MSRYLCLPKIGFLGLLAAFALIGCSQMGDPHPPQPIQFSHSLHVTQNEIACLYCHQSPDRSASATVPSVQTCMNCHEYVGRDLPEVQKVITHWERNEPIAWNKVHDQPDFVHFPHKQHVRYFLDCFLNTDSANWDQCRLRKRTQPLPAFARADASTAASMETCAQCHGPVWTMGTAQRVEPLTMGWCVDCHQDRIQLAPAEQKPLLQARMLDCTTCHK
jgi:hypothetical protein